MSSAVLISALSSATSVSSSSWRCATSTLKADDIRQSEVSSTRSHPGRNHRTDDGELQKIVIPVQSIILCSFNNLFIVWHPSSACA